MISRIAMNLNQIENFDIQTKLLEQGQSLVGGDCHRTIYSIFKIRFQFNFIFNHWCDGNHTLQETK